MTSEQIGWAEQLRKLKAEIRLGYDSHLTLYSSILFSKELPPKEVEPAIGMLEPSYKGRELIRTIAVPARSCGTFQFLYFSRDQGSLDFLNTKLAELESLLASVPPAIRPGIEIPQFRSQTDRNLIRWTSLVYWVAWQCDEVYLQAELEFESTLGRIGFYPWIECPRPLRCDPRTWMLLQSGFEKRIQEADEDFKKSNLAWPDLINGYLVEDLFVSSVTAIDLLISQLPPSLGSNDAGRNPSIKRKRRAPLTVDHDILLLKVLLAGNHPPGESREPMTQEEIGERLAWCQSKVSRRMDKLFPKGGMNYYKAFFVRENPGKGTKLLFEDGTGQVDGIAKKQARDKDDDESDN